MKIIKHLLTGIAIGACITSIFGAWVIALFGEDPYLAVWPMLVCVWSGLAGYNEYRLAELEDVLTEIEQKYS